MTKEATLLAYKIQCQCGQVNIIDSDAGSMSSDTYECGLCGTHGTVELSVYENCSNCGKSINDITLREW